MSNEIVASVNNRITEMQKNEGLKLPAGYSASNALNSAWLILSDNSKGQSLLDKTSQQSQAKALLSMVIQGLSPAKNQVYFIPYGKDLTLMRSYFGSLAILKRLENVKDVWAQVIREGDKWSVRSERGRMVVDWEPDVDSLDNQIVAAYAVIQDSNGTLNYTLMTKKQIDQAWSHGKTHNVQKEYPDQMAMRTVLNRAAKFFINSSSDNDLLVGAINETTADEYDNERKDVTETPKLDDLLEDNTKTEVTPNAEATAEPAANAQAEQGELLQQQG